jgi:murein DD-endopeptidase MepM/ murein hydrolase activator NlpD
MALLPSFCSQNWQQGGIVRRFAVLIVCLLVLPVSVARAWTWPVDGPVLRPFSFDHDHPYAGGQHRGLDLGAAAGTPVLAPADGVVSFADTVPTGGKTVSIQTPFGYTATLVHLGTIGVKRGALVGEASVVGTVGPSGQVDLTEPFVYFGVRVTADDQGYVDPLTFLPPRVAVSPPATVEPAVEASVTPSVPALAVAEPSVPTASPPAVQTPPVEPIAVPTQETASPAAASAATEAAPAAQLPQAEAAAPWVPTTAAQAAPAAARLEETPRATTVMTQQAGSEVKAGETSLIRPAVPVVAPELLQPEQPVLLSVLGSSHLELPDSFASASRHPVRRMRPGAHGSPEAEAFAPGARASSQGASTSRVPSRLAQRLPASRATHESASSRSGRWHLLFPLALAVLTLAARLLLGRRRPAPEKAARIMSLPESEHSVGKAKQQAEDFGRAGLALRGRETASRPRGGLRGTGGHLRALPPLEGERRADGQRHGRARHAGDGERRSRGRLAA